MTSATPTPGDNYAGTTVADDLAALYVWSDWTGRKDEINPMLARVENEIAHLRDDLLDAINRANDQLGRAEVFEAEVARLKVGVEHVVCDSRWTPDSVKGYLRKLISEDGVA